MTSKLWCITPVYLDVVSFTILRENIIATFNNHPVWRQAEVHFVVADDSAGQDPEIETLRQLEDVTIVQPPFNLGHQRAIVYALRTTAPLIDDDDYVVTLDADGEDAPSDVPRLLDALLVDGQPRSIVVALRTQRRESFTFKLFYLVFRALFLTLTGTTVRSGNFATYRGAVARTIIAHPSFDVSYSSSLLCLGLPVLQVPCARELRYAGQSRMGFRGLAGHGLSMLMPYLDLIAIRAVILFSAVVGLCVAVGLAIVGVKIFTGDVIPTWAIVTLVGLVIASMVAIGNFVILFAVYSQSRGMALSRLEQDETGRLERD